MFPYLEFLSAAADFRDEDPHSVATGYFKPPPLTSNKGNCHTARVAKGGRERVIVFRKLQAVYVGFKNTFFIDCQKLANYNQINVNCLEFTCSEVKCFSL